MNLVILVLDSFTPNSIRNSKTQKKTWVKEASKHSEVLFYKGSTSTKRENFDLILNCSDTYQDMGLKTLKAFEWVDENLNYDYIFRTNTSSYVHYENLIKYLKKIQDKEVNYCGYVGKYQDLHYVSGSGIILSKSSIQKILNTRKKFNNKLVEDIAIGELLKFNSILPTEGIRQDIESHDDILNIDSNQYHIRCRVDSFGYSRELERYILKYLFKKTKMYGVFLVFVMKMNQYYLIRKNNLKTFIKIKLNLIK